MKTLHIMLIGAGLLLLPRLVKANTPIAPVTDNTQNVVSSPAPSPPVHPTNAIYRPDTYEITKKQSLSELIGLRKELYVEKVNFERMFKSAKLGGTNVRLSFPDAAARYDDVRFTIRDLNKQIYALGG